MTTSNFKTAVLTLAALFTLVFTSCDTYEIADLAPIDMNETKIISYSLDPHDMIEDENAITKPYNNLGKPYHDFSNATPGDALADIPKPPGPVYTEPESKRVDVDKPNFMHDDLKIVREDTGPIHTNDAEKN